MPYKYPFYINNTFIYAEHPSCFNLIFLLPDCPFYNLLFIYKEAKKIRETKYWLRTSACVTLSFLIACSSTINIYRISRKKFFVIPSKISKILFIFLSSSPTFFFSFLLLAQALLAVKHLCTREGVGRCRSSNLGVSQQLKGVWR